MFSRDSTVATNKLEFASSGTTRASYDPGFAITSPRVAHITYDGLYRLMVNGVPSTSSATTALVDSASPFILGSNDSATSYPFGGKIAEVLIFNTSLATQDRYLVDEYLGGKWGIEMDSDGDGVPNSRDQFPTDNTRVIDIAKYAPILANLTTQANLKLWIDATGGTTRDDAGNVSKWYDLSGNGNIFSQTVVASSPQYSASSINGKPAVSFDGSNDFMTLTMATPLSTTQLTYFMVLKRITFTTNSGPMVAVTASNANDYDNVGSLIFQYQNTATDPVQDYRNGGLSSSIQTPVLNVPYLASGMFDSTSNIVYSYGSPWQAVASTGTFSFSKWYIGCRYSGSAATLYQKVDIAEVLVFNTALSTADRTLVNLYLSQKWGISADSDADGTLDTQDQFPTDNTRVVDMATTTPTLNALSTAGKSSLKLWLNASTANAVVMDASNKVSRWNDWSGSGNFIYVQADTNRPTFTLNRINGVPAMVFDGADDYLYSKKSTPLTLGDDSYTIFAVWMSATTAAIADVWEQNSASASTGKRAALLSWGTTYGFCGESKDYQAVPNVANENKISIIERIDARTADNVRVYHNGSLNTGTIADDPTSQVEVGNAWHGVGRCLPKSGEHMNGHIGEVLVFDSNLSAEDRMTVLSYLSSKWGIDVDTDGDGAPNSKDQYPLDQTKVVDMASISSTLNTLSSSAKSSMTLWLNAGTDTAIVLDGPTNISRWIDWSGKGNYVFQNNTSTRPTFIPNQQNGLSIARFNGSNQFLSSASKLMLQPGSAFVVFKPTAANYYALLGTSAYGLALNISTTGIDFAQQNYTSIASGKNIFPANQYAMAGFMYDAGNNYSLIKDGGPESTGVKATTSAVQSQTLSLGYNPLGNNLYFTGDIAEIFIFSTVLSTSDRLILNQYLSSKWSIDLDTDGDGVADSADAFPLDETRIVDMTTLSPSLNKTSQATKSGVKAWFVAY